MKHRVLYMRSQSQRNLPLQTRGGFTLVELLVVISIAALISAMTLSGFKNLSQSNRRTTCQTNLRSVYQAFRLYGADYDGNYPRYNEASAPKGIGLWALYTYENPATPGTLVTTIQTLPTPSNQPYPIERYLRSVKSLHCPADNSDDDEPLFTDAAKTTYNTKYLSYQVLDTDAGTNPEDQATYQSVRSTNQSALNWKRQLLHFSGGTPGSPTTPVNRPPGDDSIVTWCKWHRPLTAGYDVSRPYDNVLFFDGSVKTLPVEQNPAGSPTPPPPARGWQRVPTS